MGKQGVEIGAKEPSHPESRSLGTEIRSNAQWTIFEKGRKESIQIWKKSSKEEN